MKELIVFTNSSINDKLNSQSSVFPMTPVGYGVGAANGYVAVPKDHPYYGLGYDDVDVDVHGGLTYSASGEDVLESSPSIDILEGNEGNLKDYWVFGFDTCHYGDTLETWPMKAVISETLNLKRQLEEAYE